MAAMSSAPGATSLTPPSSSHGNQSGWKSYATSDYPDTAMPDRFHDNVNGKQRDPLSSQNGNSNYDPFARQDATEPFPATKELSSRGRTSNLTEKKRLNADDDQPTTANDENSKWIHRDKLARIENEELRAAGIILPKPRSHSRPRRERSQDKMNQRRATDASDSQPLSRSRKNSVMTHNSNEGTQPGTDAEATSWDLRLPEEIAEDPGEYWTRSESVGPKGSRIPVAKVSPAPISTDYLERGTPVPRKMSSGTLMPDEEFYLSIPKPRSRSGSATLDEVAKVQPAKRTVTETSPKKKTTNGARKTTKPTANGRPKTRSGSGRDGSGSSTNRPTTRSGELSPTVKSAPEGEPPWMISAYKPDPRLPPDQQLLPTVAKRLQQEQWEREGKFGNIYDREFRPLTDEGYLSPPPQKAPQSPETEEKHDEWPLRPETKSPTPSRPPSRPGTSSYSTMPKIQDKPMVSPLASPRSPAVPTHPQPPHPSQVIRIQEPPGQYAEDEKQKKRGGCGCCVVM